jgi:acetate---CoA ligase (ADP-forming)
MVNDTGRMTATSTPAPYPADREADVVLRDGSTLHVRPLRPDDRDEVHAFLTGLSRESIGFRFFGAADLEWVTKWCLDVDYRDRYGVVAETGTPRRIVGHAAYIRTDADRAEAAFLVADDWQRHGIATILLAHLSDAARAEGISTFTAVVLAANPRMVEVFRESGFELEVRSVSDEIHVEFSIALSAEARARFAERDRIAAVAAVQTVLEPRSLVVVGASRRHETVGGALLANMIGAGFPGPVYAVNEHGGTVQGVVAYRSVLDLPEPVDLAVVVVPAARVADVVTDCAKAGARAVVVISAGFGEVGAEGSVRQQELVTICRDAGIRLVGPNCLGVLNTSSSVSLNATFAPHQAQPGTIGFLSQSGGLGIAIIEAASRLGLGLSSFVSVGNKADLSSNDFLQYWEQDPSTTVALLYLESFGNPRRFSRIARRVGRLKPVIAVKSGRSPAGARGTASHTGALVAASDVTVDALFRQAGVIRVDTLSEMFDVARLLAAQPVPMGDRVAIVTNAGGPGIVCADACQAAGVQVPELEAGLANQLSAQLPATASVTNPIDMIATATAEDYRRTLSTLAASDAFDAILAIFVPPLVTEAADVAAAIRQVAETTHSCTLAAVFMTADGPPAELVDATTGIVVPGFQFPEEAAQAVAKAARYGRWRARPEGSPTITPAADVERGAAVISRELAAGAGWMSPAAVAALLDCHGIAQARWQIASDGQAAAQAAAALGGPVALKAIAPGLVHKHDVGAVVLGLDDPEAVKRAADQIVSTVLEAGFTVTAFVVQEMIGDGVELLVGVAQDQNFGPVLACGAGGTNTELLRDVAVRLTPVSDLDATEMLSELRTFPLLRGYRGSEPCDVGSVERILLRVSAMVEAHREIIELDCDPVIARPDGATVVDARIRIAAVPLRAPIPSIGR